MKIQHPLLTALLAALLCTACGDDASAPDPLDKDRVEDTGGDTPGQSGDDGAQPENGDSVSTTNPLGCGGRAPECFEACGSANTSGTATCQEGVGWACSSGVLAASCPSDTCWPPGPCP